MDTKFELLAFSSTFLWRVASSVSVVLAAVSLVFIASAHHARADAILTITVPSVSAADPSDNSTVTYAGGSFVYDITTSTLSTTSITTSGDAASEGNIWTALGAGYISISNELYVTLVNAAQDELLFQLHDPTITSTGPSYFWLIDENSGETYQNFTATYKFTTTSVPEPPSLALLVSGLVALGACGWWRKRSKVIR